MHSWDLRLQDVRRLLSKSVECELSAGAVQRLRWFLYALEHDCNVSLTCRHFGISRSSFLRWAVRFDAKNLDSLEERSRCPHVVRTSEVEQETIAIIGMLRKHSPKMGKQQIQKILTEKYGKNISASTVGRIITRHQLFFGSTPAHLEKRGESDVQRESASRAILEHTSDIESTESFPFRPEPGLAS